jgi:uncharacterized membrane protein (UPF0127 family)
MKKRLILNNTKSLSSPLTADYCNKFVCKLLGLSWRSNLAQEKALVIVEKSESKVGASIHMMGMLFDLGIVWLNSNFEVVDMQEAYRWRSFLLPRNPAQYIIELNPNRLNEFSIGDQIEFKDLH